MGYAYIFFLLRLACDNSVYAMEEKLSKLFDLVFLPVIYSAHKILESFVQEIPIDSIVSFVQDSFSGFASGNQIGLCLLIFGLLI